MVTTIVVGGFFGDEGKGKIVAHIAHSDHPPIIARGGVGPNAGHTVYKDGKKYGVRMVPSGFDYDNARLLIGAGVLVLPYRDPVMTAKMIATIDVLSGGRVNWGAGRGFALSEFNAFGVGTSSLQASSQPASATVKV